MSENPQLTQPHHLGDLANWEASVPQDGEMLFYIPAVTSLLERRPRTLKHGDMFAVFDHHGDAVSGAGTPEGIFHKDTRFLSKSRLLLNGKPPLLLSSNVQDDNATLVVDLTNPDFLAGDRIPLPRDTIHIRRSKFLWDRTAHERLGLRNFGETAQVVGLTIQFTTDFADIFEVRGRQRESRGDIEVRVFDDRVVYSCRGLDGVERRSMMAFEPKPDRIDEMTAHFQVELEPGERSSIFSVLSCEYGDRDLAISSPRRYFPCLRSARRALRRSTEGAASVETSNEVFNELIGRSVADLYMLIAETHDGPYPYAGVPWYSTAFGRDGIITALQMLWVDPSIARGVLKFLASNQAREVQPEKDAEPGKILHERRDGEMARTGEVPFGQYYGSVDSTPLFVLLAGLYLERTGDVQTLAGLWPAIDAALTWIDTYGDADGDGFIEYQRHNNVGLVNQGWKDSSDSVFHRDGFMPEGAIALCEAQAYVYAARRHAARIARMIGHDQRADQLDRAAEALQTRFEAAFWSEEIGTYAMALDADKKPCLVRSSNAGHTLFTGIASPEHARRVADQLLDRSFFSGWGIRTIATTEARYNPMSYHNGSVWPHDNALIGLGLARYRFKTHLRKLFASIFDAAAYMDLRRLPELYCGFQRGRGAGLTSYPVACLPQAWASAAPFALLQASLGLEFDVAADIVRFRWPRLPDFLDEVTLKNVTLGESRFDLLLRRRGEDTAVNVLQREGSAQVEVTV